MERSVALYQDIITSPHTLIAGTTGSGKSNVVNGIIREIMLDYTPEEAQMYLFDPKVIELEDYKDTQYCTRYETEFDGMIEALDELIEIMNERYHEMSGQHIKEYQGTRIYLIFDELADALTAPPLKVINMIKSKLQVLLQKGRASRISVIAASQNPNREIVAGKLTINFTNRLGLRCLNDKESKAIVTRAGCELLPKYGKALYLSPDGFSEVKIPLTPNNWDLIQRYRKVRPVQKSIEQKPFFQPKQNDAAASLIALFGLGLMLFGLFGGIL